MYSVFSHEYYMRCQPGRNFRHDAKLFLLDLARLKINILNLYNGLNIYFGEGTKSVENLLNTNTVCALISV